MYKILSAIAFAGSLAIPVAAHAVTYNFAASGGAGGFNGTGILTGTSNANGSFTITGITGTGITGYIAPGGFTFSPTSGTSFTNDDLLFPSAATLVDNNGFAFTDVNGDTSFRVDIFSPSAGMYDVSFLDNDGTTATLPVTLTISTSATPEPSSLILLGTGAIGLLGAARRRFTQA